MVWRVLVAVGLVLALAGIGLVTYGLTVGATDGAEGAEGDGTGDAPSAWTLYGTLAGLLGTLVATGAFMVHAWREPAAKR